MPPFASLAVLLQDTKALQVEKRSLEYALAESQREAFALATQLERASEILETAQKDAAAAQATASTARGRSSLLEKAWTAALQVRCNEVKHKVKHTGQSRWSAFGCPACCLLF